MPDAAADLTVREREILALLVDGLSNKDIAQRLVLSPRTVETHIERVLGGLAGDLAIQQIKEVAGVGKRTVGLGDVSPGKHPDVSFGKRPCPLGLPLTRADSLRKLSFQRVAMSGRPISGTRCPL